MSTPDVERSTIASRATRRSLLAGTAVGLAGLAASGASGLMTAVPAEAATTGTDWTVLSPMNDPSGVKDTHNINSALHSSAPGQVVYLSAGVYFTNAPILIPQGVGLRGPIGATQSGDASSQRWGAVLAPVSGWTASNTVAPGMLTLPVSGVITLIDITSNGTANTVSARMDIRDLWIDGSNGPAGVDGIASWGAMKAVNIERVGVNQVSGNGIDLQLNTNFNGSNFPDGWTLDTVIVQTAGGDGLTGHFVDCTLINCHAQLCHGDGIKVLGGNNRLTACRSDLSGGYGYTIEAVSGGDGFFDANTLIGCGTQLNKLSGLYVPNTSSSGQDQRNPVLAIGCSFDGDGVVGGTDTGHSGIEAFGEVRLIAVGCEVLAATKGVSTGSPQHAITTRANGAGVPDLVQVTGSFLNSMNALINDAAPALSLRVDPTNSGWATSPFTGTATPALPVQQPAYLGAVQENFLHQAGVVAATIPRAMASTAQAKLASGTLYVTALGIQAGVEVSRCTLFVNGTAASGLSHGWYVLLDRNLNVLAVTADQTSGTWAAADTGYALAFAAPHTAAYSGLHYVGVMVEAATTPTFSGAASLATGVSVLAGLSPASPVYSGASSSGLSTPPAVGTTLSPIKSDGAYVFYATLS